MKKTLYISVSFLFLTTTLLATEPDTAFNNQFRVPIGGWIAADATYSIFLPDGRTLWLFGDTFIGETQGITIKPGSKFIRNSAVIQNNTDLQTLFSGNLQNPGDLIKTSSPDSNWYWPEHGIVDNDTLRIFLAKFKHIDNGSAGFNFDHDGNDIANFSYPDLQFISTVKIVAHHKNQVIYGDRILTDSSHHYIYGRKSDPSQNNLPYPHVARTTIGNLANQDTWEYFNGSSWTTDPTSTKRINNFRVSQQYSVTQYKNKYILLTQDTWLSPKIYTFISDTPIGPWKYKTLIYTTPETEGSTFTYNAYAHPQFNKNGTLLVSYNTNGDFWSIFDNVELYRPRFIRVPYMSIAYDFWPNSISAENKTCAFSIYPNPATDYINIHLNNAQNDNITLQIISLNGTVLRSMQLLAPDTSFQDISISLNDLNNGIYLIKILGPNMIETKQISISR